MFPTMKWRGGGLLFFLQPYEIEDFHNWKYLLVRYDATKINEATENCLEKFISSSIVCTARISPKKKARMKCIRASPRRRNDGST